MPTSGGTIGARFAAATAARTGLPVTTAPRNGVPGSETAARAPKRTPTRFAKTGRRVLLVHDGWDSPGPRREQTRQGRIATDTEDDPRTMPTDQPKGASKGAQRPEQRADVVANGGRAKASPQTPPWKELDLEARLGHGTRLEPAFGANEPDRSARVAAADQLLGNSQRRVDVTAGAPARDQREDRFGRDVLGHRDARLLGAPAGVRAMFASIPAATIVNTNDEPPKDTNGNGMPETGSSPTTPPMLTAAWATTQTVTPVARSMPKRSGVRRSANPECGERDEETQHDHGPDEARALHRSPRR